MSKLSTKDKLIVAGLAYIILHIALCVCLFFMGFDFIYPADPSYDRNDRDFYYDFSGWWSALSTLGCCFWCWVKSL